MTKKIKVLQAVADASFGAMFASTQSVKEQLADDFSNEELENILTNLETECLIERRVIKNIPHVGLTEDGKSCGLIYVVGL